MKDAVKCPQCESVAMVCIPTQYARSCLNCGAIESEERREFGVILIAVGGDRGE